jgi:hypothetical protein
MCNEIQTSGDILEWTLQNPFTRMELFHVDGETDGDKKDNR